ncbi:MAG: type II secretion system secretin GspD [Thermodesulfobacteriota bacterium]|nr:type II secretion system secretin GspD [Thermodesulfobacteriota bacterium]
MFRVVVYVLCFSLFLLTQPANLAAVRLSDTEGVGPLGPEPPDTVTEQELVPPPEGPPATKISPPPVTAREERRVQAVPPAKPRPVPKRLEERFVTIDFDDVDILLFVKFISEVTGRNFVIDQKVKGKVTIVSPTKISVDEAYRVFESVLEVHGFTTVEAGSITKIVPSVAARGKSIETRLREEIDNPDDRVVTQIIRLDYANPDELKRLFAPLISKSSVIVSYPPTNMLLVTDVLSNIKRLLRIIRAIDVVGIGEEISVVPLEHAIASVMIKPLTSIFTTGKRPTRGKKGASALAPAIQIVADERTNSLVISASEHDTYRIKQLIKILDQETPRGAGDIRVYYLQYADAEELAKVLTALPSDGKKTAAKGKAPVISKEVEIVADKATNSLVITANKQDFLTLVDVIKKLDISRPMVYIEALIMEVKATKDFSLGVEWQVADDVGTWEGRTIGAFGSSGAGVEGGLLAQATAPKGLTLGVVGEGITIKTGMGDVTFPTIGAMVRAFHSDSDVHILQTPQILTTDNEEAEIKVADNVPYLTKEATGEQQYQTYEYKDVGVTLKITPQINQERFVRLKIFQEYITLAEQEGASSFRPTTLKRSADTTVVVRDRHTIVIGGLVGDQISKGTSGAPCLGNIPLLGWLFKSKSRNQTKTNLFVFLTPHIIENPAEAKKIYQEKMDNIEAAEEGVIKMYQNPLPGFSPSLELVDPETEQWDDEMVE